MVLRCSLKIKSELISERCMYAIGQHTGGVTHYYITPTTSIVDALLASKGNSKTTW